MAISTNFKRKNIINLNNQSTVFIYRKGKHFNVYRMRYVYYIVDVRFYLLMNKKELRILIAGFL